LIPNSEIAWAESLGSLLAVVQRNECRAMYVVDQDEASVTLLKTNNYKAEEKIAEDWLKAMDVIE
jgi:hypothetical protein